MKIPKTKTEFTIWVYCLAIILLASCSVVIVMKLIFWPPCTQSGSICVIDGWSVAGLAGTILGVAATMLGILGAVAVAAWWVSLNDRVTDQVNNLYKAQEKEINSLILKSRVTKYELVHLQNFDAPGAFLAENRDTFIPELRHLLSLDLIDRQPDHGFRSLNEAFKRNKKVNVKEHFHITGAGKDYLDQIK